MVVRPKALYVLYLMHIAVCGYMLYVLYQFITFGVSTVYYFFVNDDFRPLDPKIIYDSFIFSFHSIYMGLLLIASYGLWHKLRWGWAIAVTIYGYLFFNVLFDMILNLADSYISILLTFNLFLFGVLFWLLLRQKTSEWFNIEMKSRFSTAGLVILLAIFITIFYRNLSPLLVGIIYG